MKWRLKIFAISLLVGFNSLSLANNSNILIYTTENQKYDTIEIMNLIEGKKTRIKDICIDKYSKKAVLNCNDQKVIKYLGDFLNKSKIIESLTTAKSKLIDNLELITSY
ncbi:MULTISPECIES: hypothetical protein [Arsenophonus]|jgi:hypothetical protein|uniref:hypothetical protein n=1 Tax=Arsenophonus TaxID=637 RepID=UPI00387A186D